MKTRVVSLVVMLLWVTFAHAQDRKTLKEFRAHFLNQRVVVNSDFVNTAYSFLGGWKSVKEKKGPYTTDYSKEVPSTFVGHTGIIIAIQAPLSLPFGTPSGQTDDTYVEYAEAIVRLDSGELISTSLYNNNTGTELSDAFTLLSLREKHKQEAEDLAPKLAGKSLYLTRLTPVYDMGLTTANIQTIKAGVGYSQALITDLPLLTPIPVVEVRYSEPLDLTMVILQLPDGRKTIYVLGCVVEEPKAGGCASTSMPSSLTDGEVEAVQKGSVFVGMSESALYMAMGFPQHTNSAVVGVTQLVYLTAYIYLDRDKRVVEIQSRN